MLILKKKQERKDICDGLFLHNEANSFKLTNNILCWYISYTMHTVTFR